MKEIWAVEMTKGEIGDVHHELVVAFTKESDAEAYVFKHNAYENAKKHFERRLYDFSSLKLYNSLEELEGEEAKK